MINLDKVILDHERTVTSYEGTDFLISTCDKFRYNVGTLETGARINEILAIRKHLGSGDVILRTRVTYADGTSAVGSILLNSFRGSMRRGNYRNFERIGNA